MYDPKTVFSGPGLEDYMYHIKALEVHVAYIENQMDDLHIGSTDPALKEAIHSLSSILPTLKTGNGEER